MTTDSSLCTDLVLLDLSGAFNNTEHNILLNHLDCEVGIHGSALNWFSAEGQNIFC